MINKYLLTVNSNCIRFPAVKNNFSMIFLKKDILFLSYSLQSESFSESLPLISLKNISFPWVVVHLVDLIDKEKQEPSATRDRRMLRSWKQFLILVKILNHPGSLFFNIYSLNTNKSLKNLPEGKKLPGIHSKVSIFVWRLCIGLRLKPKLKL